ncbi:MAG: sulfite exporter TauE/SafE family protein [Verrucomicrobia bacterium]|nr:sulfite exporter TauE/SafE family protein [Verrucomicrobiota bacterium]
MLKSLGAVLAAAPFLAIGLLGGFASGLLGVGGGIIMVPAMNLLAQVPIKTAIGTSLAVIIPTALIGVREHHRQGNVDWRIALPIAVTAIVGGYIGARLAGSVSPVLLKRSFGILMVLVGARMALGK